MFLFLRLRSWLLASGLLLLGSLVPWSVQAQTPPTFDMATRLLRPISGADGSITGRPYTQEVVVDAAGNSYVSGYVSGRVLFGGGIILPPGSASLDYYIAQIDATGTAHWVTSFNLGTTASANSIKLALDAAGNLYAAGEFTSTITGVGNTALTNAGGSDLFVGKLNPTTGQWLSAIRVGGPGNETLTGLAVDGLGNAYLTGAFTGTTSFGATALTSAGGPDFFMARLATTGTWSWAVRGGGAGTDWTSEIGLDAHNNAYVAGHFDASGGQVGAASVAGAATLVLKLDPLTGTPQPLGSFTYTNPFQYAHLAVAATGDCYVAGSFLGQLHLGSRTLTSVGVGLSNDDAFVAKLTAQGTWQWANLTSGSSGEICTGVAVDARKQVYVTGYFRGPGSHFGAITLVSQNAALFLEDVFVAKLDEQGNWLWAVPAGGQQADRSLSLALGPYGTPHIVGEYFSPTMNFGPLTLAGEPALSASTFLARMQPDLVTISGDSLLCTGGSTQLTASTLASAVSWRWNTGATTPTLTVTQPGTYTVTATFAGGYQLTAQFQVRSFTPSVQISGGAGYLCPGTPRQLTAQASNARSVRWSTGATTASILVTKPGTYSVTATYGSGCPTTAQVTLVANDVTITGRAQLCPGQSTTLTAAATGSAVTSYRWNTGATTPTLLVGQAGTYQVTVSLADGCQLTTSHVVGPPVAKVASISGDTLLCPSTTLTLTALNPDALSYRWSTGATTPTISVRQPGQYGVVLTFSGGCSSRDSLQVGAVPVLPLFTLGADTTLCLEQPLVLHAPAVSGPGVRRRWSDGSSGLSLLVQAAGTYSLEISTPCERRTVTRQVAYTSCLVIPNIITPNGDQLNDRFAFAYLPSGAWELTLYNRWGRQVYYSAAYHQDWGEDAAAGMYYYRLRQVTTGESHRGWLEVIR